jgi:hypothetical protein
MGQENLLFKISAPLISSNSQNLTFVRQTEPVQV